MKITPWMIFKPILIITVVVAVPSAFYLLTKLGPRPLDEVEITSVDGLSDDVQTLLDESRQLEQQFNDIAVLRQPSEEDLLLLTEAIRVLDEAISRSTGYIPEEIERRKQMKMTFDEGMALRLSRDLAAKEEEAKKLKEAGSIQDAQRAFRRAYQLQTRINTEFSASTYVDVGRATRLSREITFIESEPLYDETIQFEKQAEEAYRSNNWEDARNYLRRAILTQERLNQEYRNTRRASIVRLASLRAREITYKTAQAHAEKEALVTTAEAFVKAKDWDAAANAYDEARRIQRDINTQFPTSGYASNQAVLELEVSRQTALSAELFGRISSQTEELNNLLRDRRTGEASELVPLINRDLSDLRSQFTRHQHDAESIELKIAFLNVIRQRFDEIQNRIFDSMLPLPGNERVLMSKLEVEQDLYSLIMLNNPSLIIGSKRPVNGITYEEAESFCERLSWIIGRPIRLPTKEEFRVAVGSLRFVKLEEIAHAKADEATSPTLLPAGSLEANRYGFKDLLGNAREWLQRNDDTSISGARWVAGGSADDPYSQIVQMPIEEMPARSSDMFTGFRIVIE